MNVLYISAWCTTVCMSEPHEDQREGWSKVTDDLLFTLSVSCYNPSYWTVWYNHRE